MYLFGHVHIHALAVMLLALRFASVSVTHIFNKGRIKASITASTGLTQLYPATNKFSTYNERVPQRRGHSRTTST